MRFVALGCALLLVACNGDSTAPAPSNIAGLWHLTLTNLTSAGVTCSVAIDATFTQQASTFTGTYSSTRQCAGPTGAGGGVSNGTIASGSVNLDALSFDLDTSDSHFSGTVNGVSMAGTATIAIVIPGGQRTIMSGNWSGAR